MRAQPLAIATSIVLGLLAGCPQPEPDQVKTTLRTEFYRINGTSSDQIRDDLDRLSPVVTEGERYDAGTDWWLTWRYDPTDIGFQCIPTNVRVSLELTFHFPRWEDAHQADTALTRTWDLYMDNLREHEQGHARIATSGARRLLAGLTGPDHRASDCHILDEQFDAIGTVLIDEVTAQQEAFDATTRHGAMQGAVFP